MLGIGGAVCGEFPVKIDMTTLLSLLGYVLNKGGNLNISHHIVESTGKTNSLLSFESFKLLLRFDDRLKSM